MLRPVNSWQVVWVVSRIWKSKSSFVPLSLCDRASFYVQWWNSSTRIKSMCMEFFDQKKLKCVCVVPWGISLRHVFVLLYPRIVGIFRFMCLCQLEFFVDRHQGLGILGTRFFRFFLEISSSIWVRGRFQIFDSVRLAGVDVFSLFTSRSFDTRRQNQSIFSLAKDAANVQAKNCEKCCKRNWTPTKNRKQMWNERWSIGKKKNDHRIGTQTLYIFDFSATRFHL